MVYHSHTLGLVYVEVSEYSAVDQVSIQSDTEVTSMHSFVLSCTKPHPLC